LTCPSLEKLIFWCLHESSDVETNEVEEHLFSCDRCTGRTERVDAMIRSLRSAVPPVLTAGRRRRLEETVTPIPKAEVQPGASATLEFKQGNEIGFWLMKGDLEGVERVDCDLLAADGSPLASFPDVPFDADRREVVLACQIHYVALGFPADMKARLTSFEENGGQRVAEYRLIHQFSSDDV
jgi:anti-sigma factor RsiW